MSRSSRCRIELLGIVGAGKTTLLRYLETTTTKRLSFCYENLGAVERELAFWNASRATRSFVMQTAFYLRTASQYGAANHERVLVADNSLLGHHLIYSRALVLHGMLTDVEWALLSDLHQQIAATLPPLAGLVYVRASASTVQRHLQSRSAATDFSREIAQLDLLEQIADDTAATASVPILRIDIDSERSHADVSRFELFIEREVAPLF